MEGKSVTESKRLYLGNCIERCAYFLKNGAKVLDLYIGTTEMRTYRYTYNVNRNMDSQITGRNNMEGSTVANRLTTALLIIYLIALFWILLFKLGVRFSYMEERSVNLIPFRKPLIVNGKAAVGEIFLNTLIFVPLGAYAGILFDRWNFGRKLFFFFLLSLIIECLQFVLAVGAFDVTDLLTNTFGGMIGLLLFKVIERSFKNGRKAQRFINIIAATGTVLVLLLLVLLKLNMLPVRYQ